MHYIKILSNYIIMDNINEFQTKKRGRPSKAKKEKKPRIFKPKCPMCDDLNKKKILNIDKITTVIDLKPVIFKFD